jgi:hypothetical protein
VEEFRRRMYVFRVLEKYWRIKAARHISIQTGVQSHGPATTCRFDPVLNIKVYGIEAHLNSKRSHLYLELASLAVVK